MRHLSRRSLYQGIMELGTFSLRPNPVTAFATMHDCLDAPSGSSFIRAGSDSFLRFPGDMGRTQGGG